MTSLPLSQNHSLFQAEGLGLLDRLGFITDCS